MRWEVERDESGMPVRLFWLGPADPEAEAAARVRRRNVTRRRIDPGMERWARDHGYLKPEDIGNPEATMTLDEWKAKGKELFGGDFLDWAFVCPVCKHVATARDYRDAGAPPGAVAFSCVGRWAGAKREAFGGPDDGKDLPGPCNYSGSGLFMVNPVEVEGFRVFAFAEPGGTNAEADKVPVRPEA